MGLSQITLTDYDAVVAVTQNALNETLATYLSQLKKQVGLFFNVDSGGNYVAAPDPATADYSFTGTLDYTLDAKGNPVNMVQLHSPAGPQMVLYNISFSKAQFIAKAPPVNVSQKPGGSPWVISFSVNLQKAQVALASVPAPTRAAISAATSGLGPNMFSIQQLYLDLNTAVFDSFQNVTGMPAFALDILTGIMQQYLADLQASGGVIFGYSLTAAGAAGATPTFMPTALDFCVSQYKDANGAPANPGLDTLNYLIMTGNRPLPAKPPTGFNFNFVDDNTMQGAMAVRSGLYLGFLIGALNYFLKTISPVAFTDANGTLAQQFQLHEGVDHSFTEVIPPQNGFIATYTYSSPNGTSSFKNFWGSATSTPGLYLYLPGEGEWRAGIAVRNGGGLGGS